MRELALRAPAPCSTRCMATPHVDDPKSSTGKPQGTLHDQQQTMESEGQPVAPTHDGPSTDPAVNAETIFEKLEQQAASERGDQDAIVDDGGPETTSKD